MLRLYKHYHYHYQNYDDCCAFGHTGCHKQVAPASRRLHRPFGALLPAF
ncbi:MAG: hypothetical protein J6S84_08950 [Bacteroidales bacterium]|nr:hypothetical protein [Bacteroidales bacterium]MBR3797813.1 hypothetical protein [Bacteroidales bacterium]